MTFELNSQLNERLERLTPALQAAKVHGFTRDAGTLRALRACRAALLKAQDPDASEDELQSAIEHVDKIGPQLLAAINPGGLA